MTVFSALMLEKMRFILLLQFSASSKKYLSERVSEDDMKYIELEAAKKGLTPSTLIVLLEAVGQISRAQIEILPLELAVIRICS